MERTQQPGIVDLLGFERRERAGCARAKGLQALMEIRVSVEQIEAAIVLPAASEQRGIVLEQLAICRAWPGTRPYPVDVARVVEVAGFRNGGVFEIVLIALRIDEHVVGGLEVVHEEKGLGLVPLFFQPVQADVREHVG